MQKEGRPCGRPSRLSVMPAVLGRQLADPRRPVAERGPRARPMTGAGARAEQIVARAARDERSGPGGVVTGVGDVVAGEPDRVPGHGRCTIVTPPRPRRIASDLLFVAREAVVNCGTFAAGNVVPRPDARIRID